MHVSITTLAHMKKGIYFINKRLSQMLELQSACRGPAGDENRPQRFNMFLVIKRSIFKSMLHIRDLWYFDISKTYPQGFPRVEFVILTPCLIWHQYLLNISIPPTGVRSYS